MNSGSMYHYRQWLLLIMVSFTNALSRNEKQCFIYMHKTNFNKSHYFPLNSTVHVCVFILDNKSLIMPRCSNFEEKKSDFLFSEPKYTSWLRKHESMLVMPRMVIGTIEMFVNLLYRERCDSHYCKHE